MAFSSNVQLLASAGDDQSVRLWDRGSALHTGTLQGHAGWLGAVAFSPDGHLLASRRASRRLLLITARWAMSSYRTGHF